MKNVTDRLGNPFDMDPPCPHPCEGATDDRRVVFGYGDANADFHVIGDHPGIHGGAATGIPFTDPPSDRLLSVLERVGLVDADDDGLTPRNCFLSLRYCCCLPAGETPSATAYAELEPFFDAELRAITAHVLLPVGASTTAHVLDQYSSVGHRVEVEMERLHGRHVRGRGFLIVPIRDPADWVAEDRTTLTESLETLMASDYRQEADLGRFIATDNGYFVR